MDRTDLLDNSMPPSDGHSSMRFLSYDSACYLVQASDVYFGQPLESFHFFEKHHSLARACVSPLRRGLLVDWRPSNVPRCVHLEHLHAFATEHGRPSVQYTDLLLWANGAVAFLTFCSHCLQVELQAGLKVLLKMRSYLIKGGFCPS